MSGQVTPFPLNAARAAQTAFERDELMREGHVPLEAAPGEPAGPVEAPQTEAEIDETGVAEPPAEERPVEEEAPRRGRRKSSSPAKGRTRKTKNKAEPRAEASEEKSDDGPRPMESAEHRTGEGDEGKLFHDEDLSFSLGRDEEPRPERRDEAPRQEDRDSYEEHERYDESEPVGPDAEEPMEAFDEPRGGPDVMAEDDFYRPAPQPQP